MNVEENIAFGLKLKKKTQQYVKDKIAYALKLVNMEGYEKRSPMSLSGGAAAAGGHCPGYRQRAKVLLLDEPLGALDLKLRTICSGADQDQEGSGDHLSSM